MTQRNNILLYPASLIFGMITGIRNFLYNNDILHSVEFNIPIICVGNLAVGGTGKTPHTEYLAVLLKEHFKVAVLSRGYKRKTRDFRIASSSSMVTEIGDEPLQISRKFPDVLVSVDSDRANGVKLILEQHPETEVIILDDGFQHRRIKPGFSIILTDFERIFFNDHLMPYGRLRESKINLRRANLIIVTKTPENLDPVSRRLMIKDINKSIYQNLYFTSIAYKAPTPVFGKGNPDSIFSQSQENGIVLLTGIANPKPLLEYLNKSFTEIVHLSYPDHYNYDEKDINTISSAYNGLKSKFKYVLTTEKDATRLRELKTLNEPLKSSLFYIPVSIDFPNGDREEFDKIIVDYVRTNNRNHRIPKG